MMQNVENSSFEEFEILWLLKQQEMSKLDQDPFVEDKFKGV